MALVAPPQVINAPPRTPDPYGLFSVATPIQDPALNWENGIVWVDQDCDPLPPAIVPDCAAPVGLPKDLTTDLSQGVSDAFTIYGEFSCSPVGFTPQQAIDMAAARLLTREEQAVTARVVTLVSTAGPLQGTNVAGPTTVPTAIPALEAHLAANYGAQGVLILTLEALAAAASAFLIERQGATLRTVAGTPIAIDRLGDDIEAAIIPAPVLYRSEVFSPSAEQGDLLDRASNNLFGVAERSYVVGWVPCGGAYVDLT